MRREFVLFDQFDKPVGISIPVGLEPAPSTLETRGATLAKLASRCTREQYEDARRAENDFEREKAGPKRRRAGGHGYRGGTGFANI